MRRWIATCLVMIGCLAPFSAQAMWGMRWAWSLDGYGPVPEAPAESARVYIENQGDELDSFALVALDRERGDENWRFLAEHARRASNILEHEGRLYVALNDHRLLVLNAVTGKQVAEIGLPPKRDVGRLRFCEASLCALMGDLTGNAPDHFFSIAESRPVQDLELVRFNLQTFNVESRTPLLQERMFPRDFFIQRETLILQNTDEIAVYILTGDSRQALIRYPAPGKDAHLDESGVFWLDHQQLLSLSPLNPRELRPQNLPEQSRRLLARTNEWTYALRTLDDAMEVWRLKTPVGSPERAGSLALHGNVQAVVNGTWLGLTDANAVYVLGLLDGLSRQERRVPWLSGVAMRPVTASDHDIVVAASEGTRMQVVSFGAVPPADAVTMPPAFSARVEDPARRAMLGLNAGVQWEAALAILREQLERLTPERATAPGLGLERGSDAKREALLALLKQGDHRLLPLLMGELALLNDPRLAAYYRDLYYAIENHLKRPTPPLSDTVLDLRRQWPASFTADDDRRLARWLLEQLSRQGYDSVAELYRDRLEMTGLDYLDQLDAVRVLWGHPEEEERLVRWADSHSAWDPVQAPFDRRPEVIDAEHGVGFTESGESRFMLLVRDYPLANSLWLAVGTHQERTSYFTGVKLSASYAEWLRQAQSEHRAQAAALVVKRNQVTVTLNKPNAKHTFTLDLDDLTRDQDHDGLMDMEEASLGLNPAEPDSDHDGVPDGVDVNPLVGNVPKMTEEQRVLQAVHFYLAKSAEATASARHVRWVDFGTLGPVELPGTNEMILPFTKPNGEAACHFEVAQGQGPFDARVAAPVLYAPNDREAWITQRCDGGDATVYHLFRMGRQWVVLERSAAAPHEER